MTPLDIARLRLSNQRIASSTFGKPGDVVAWLGAVQAQDYLGALWAVGLRMREATEEVVERALAERSIVRTWPMRGTLHFVAAQDVRWMLDLMTPRIVYRNAARLQREYGLDDAVYARGRELFIAALQGGRQLTREAMYRVLEAGGVSTKGQRGIHILWKLAHDGLLCFGAREGKQQTFVLLDEWVPRSKTLDKDEALAELARRYFTSRGPATLQDFVWWSGLTVADAKAAIAEAKGHLIQEEAGGQTYWLASSAPGPAEASPDAHLLPAFDEYTVAYKDRSAVLDPSQARKLNAGGGMLNPVVVIDGRVAGTWKRTLKKKSVVIAPSLFAPLKRAEKSAFTQAARRYGAFLGLPMELA